MLPATVIHIHIHITSLARAIPDHVAQEGPPRPARGPGRIFKITVTVLLCYGCVIVMLWLCYGCWFAREGPLGERESERGREREGERDREREIEREKALAPFTFSSMAQPTPPTRHVSSACLQQVAAPDAPKKFGCPFCCHSYAKFSAAKKHIYEVHYEKVSELELYDDKIHSLCSKANLRICYGPTLKDWWPEADTRIRLKFQWRHDPL